MAIYKRGKYADPILDMQIEEICSTVNKQSNGSSLPSRTSHSLDFLRVKSDESGAEWFDHDGDAGAHGGGIGNIAYMDSRWYGAIGDGAPHPLSERYGSLAAAQAAYPLCHAQGWITSLTDYIDWAAIQEYILAQESGESGHVQLGRGWFVVNRSLLANGINGGLTIEGRGEGYYGGASYDWVRPETALLSDGNFTILDARRSNITLRQFHVSDIAQSTDPTTIAGYTSTKIGILVGNDDKINIFTTLNNISATGLYGGVHFLGGTTFHVTHSFFGWVKDYGILQEDDWDIDTGDKLYAHNYFKTIRDTAWPNAAGLKITGGGGVKISDNTFQGLTHGILVDGKVAVNNGGSVLAGTVMLHIVNNTFDNCPYNIRVRRGAANHTGYSSIQIIGNTFGVYNVLDLGTSWTDTCAVDIDGYETTTHPIVGVKVIGNNSYTGGDIFCRINNVKQVDVSNNGSNGAFTTVYNIGSGVVDGRCMPGIHASGYTTLLNNQSSSVYSFASGPNFYVLDRSGIDTNLVFAADDLTANFSFLNRSSTSARFPSLSVYNFDGAMYGGYPRIVARGYKGSSTDSAADRILSGSGNVIGDIAFESSDGVSNGAIGASIKAITTSQWTSTNSPTRLSFGLGGDGVGPFGTTEIASIQSDGVHLASGKKYYGEGDQLTGIIPSQTGNGGKVLTTNGSTVSWGSVAAGFELSRRVTGGQTAQAGDSVVEFTATGTYAIPAGLTNKKGIIVSNTGTGTVTISAGSSVTLNGSPTGTYDLTSDKFAMLGEDPDNIDSWITVFVGSDGGTVDLTPYALLAGRSGGQTLKGDTAASGNLTLQSTAHATKGKILFGTSAYDEANNRLGIGTVTPQAPVDMTSGVGSVRLNVAGGVAPGLFTYTAGTSIASPTAVSSGAYGTLIQPAFYDGGAYRQFGYAFFQVSGAVSSGTVPTDFIVVTGSTAGAERLRIKASGLLQFSNGGGLPSGNMYSNTSTTITVGASGTWYEVDTGATDFTAGQLTGVTHTDHYLTVPVAGKYMVTANVSFGTSTASDEIAVSVMVNGTAQDSCHGHATVVNAATTVPSSCSTILSLAANDQVSLAVQNHSAARNITLSHAQLVLVHVGS